MSKTKPKTSTIEELRALPAAEREEKKLLMEIQALEKSLVTPEKDFIDKAKEFFEKYVGQLITIATLIAGVALPVISYVSTERKNQFLLANGTLLEIADTSIRNTDAWKLRAATQDPAVAAPFLLAYLNNLHGTPNKEVDEILIRNLYARMYKINQYAPDRPWWDNVIFWFSDDNVDIIKNVLYKNARSQFENTPPEADGVVQTYVDLLYQLPVEHDSDFNKVVAVLQAKCGKPEYAVICKYLETKK